MKFMILANPRSRTKWTSEYLSSYGAKVGHELVVGCSSVDEYLDKIQDYDGVVETSTALGYRLWKNAFPDIRFIIIHRTVIGVAESLERLNLVPDWAFIYIQEMMLGRAIGEFNIPVFTFEGLDRIENRKRLCEATVGYFDHRNDTIFASQNIQINIQERLEFLKNNQSCFASFHNDVAKQIVYLENNENE